MPTHTPFEEHPENIPDEIVTPHGKNLGYFTEVDKKNVDEGFERLAKLIKQLEDKTSHD